MHTIDEQLLIAGEEKHSLSHDNDIGRSVHLFSLLLDYLLKVYISV